MVCARVHVLLTVHFNFVDARRHSSGIVVRMVAELPIWDSGSWS